MSETKLETDCKNLARAHGCEVRKVRGRRGMFDRQIWVPQYVSRTHAAFVWFVEFKNPDKTGRMSALQELERDWLTHAGFPCHRIDDYGEFERLFRGMVVC